MAENNLINQRVVFFGSAKVGKTTILSQFLSNRIPHKYTPTIEDLHSREYKVGNQTLQVSFLDTSGENSFPAMRQLSISTANAFVLVYSIEDEGSWVQAKQLFYEIKETKPNAGDIPLLIVGNKVDLAERRTVPSEDVEDFISSEGWGAAFMEIAAVKQVQVMELFHKLLHQWRHPLARDLITLAKLKLRSLHSTNNNKVMNLSVVGQQESSGGGGAFKRTQSLYRRSSTKKNPAKGGRRESMDTESISISDCSIM